MTKFGKLVSDLYGFSTEWHCELIELTWRERRRSLAVLNRMIYRIVCYPYDRASYLSCTFYLMHFLIYASSTRYAKRTRTKRLIKATGLFCLKKAEAADFKSAYAFTTMISSADLLRAVGIVSKHMFLIVLVEKILFISLILSSYSTQNLHLSS